jgi:two-component system, response regulator, stage 0 sporulation protein F
MTEKTTILYVDDEPINLKLFELNFRSKYNVITALSGTEALDKLNLNLSVSVVISDMRMPGMSGLEFITIAKDTYPNIVYYILTGFDITDEINNALSNRLIHKYFRKPFNFREIESSINEALQ